MRKNKEKKNQLLTLSGVPGNPAQHTHTSHLDCDIPQYFPSCFPLAFLEGHCLSSSLKVTSLCLDPITWNLSVLSNKAASSTSTLSRSCWRYSNYFFFFFSSASLYFLAFSFVLASASLLAF